MDTDTLSRILSEHDIRHRDLALIANVTTRAVSMCGQWPPARAKARRPHTVRH